MLASFAPVKPCPACTARPSRPVRTSRKRARVAFAEQHAQPADNSGGSPDVQEKLMDIIRVQIGQEKVKDFVKDEGEKLRQAAEEVSSTCHKSLHLYERAGKDGSIDVVLTSRPRKRLIS